MANVNSYTVWLAVIYFVVILGIGFWAGKLTKTMSMYMVGGRSLGIWVTSFGIMAAVMSGWTWLGGPGGSYSAGYAYYVQILSVAYIGVVICYYLLAKPIRIVSERTGCYTLPDLLAARFHESRGVRALSALIILIGCMCYLVTQWASMGVMVGSALGLSYVPAVLIGAVVISAYVIAGGMLASMWTNFVQMVIMFVVAVYVIWDSVNRVGGFTEMNVALAAVNPEFVEPWWKEGQWVITYVLSYSLFITGIAYGGQPAANTKFIMIRDTKALRWSALITVVAYIVGTFVFVVGLAGRVMVENGTLPAPGSPDQILPLMINHLYSPLAGALIIVAVLAAVMSTAETYLFTSAAGLVRDLWVRSLGFKMSEQKQLFWIRVIMTLVTVSTVIIALKPPALIAVLGAQAFATFCSGFGPVMYLAFRWKKVTSTAAIWGMSTGLAIGGLLPILNSAFFGGNLMRGWTIGGLASVAAWVVVIVVTLVTKDKEPVSQVFNPEYRANQSEDISLETAKAGA
jgi:sodium/proline symporter